MRVIFAGTPDFARQALLALAQAGHDIVLVMTQPDRPGGRGMKLQASPVKQAALERGWPLLQVRSLRHDGKYPQDAAQAQTAIEAAQADVMVVAAYGLILPQWVLDSMRRAGATNAGASRALGCLNIHASLLPRWRGAAPIHRAIEAGDSHTGVTIMQMDAGLDTGDMLLWQSIPIGPDETTASLHDRLAVLGAELIVRALALAERGALTPSAQTVQGACYAPKVDKAEAWLDWRLSALKLERRVRAFNPSPGAATCMDGQTYKVWRAALAQPMAATLGEPGCVLAVDDAGVLVAAGAGTALRLTELQKAGGKRLALPDFLRGANLRAGMQFALPDQCGALLSNAPSSQPIV